MLFRQALCAALLIGAATDGHAGAWPRATGSAFLSITRTTAPLAMPEIRDGLTSLYGEYGVGPRLTLGAKLDRTLIGDTIAAAFARRHLSGPDARTQWAVELSLGRIESAGASEPSATVAGIVGRGFSTRWGNGWAEADLRLTRRVRTGDAWSNLDLTVGLAFSDSNKVYVQTRTYVDRYGTETVLAPAYLRSLPFGMTARLGLAWEVGSDVAPSLELGTWLEF